MEIRQNVREGEEEVKKMEKYMESKKGKYTDEDLRQRLKTKDLLKKSLRLITNELEGNSENIKDETADKRKMLFGETGHKKKEIMSDSMIDPELGTNENAYEDRSLDEDEKRFMDEIEGNDREIVSFSSYLFLLG